ncbi:MAG: hypothetical protein PHV62_05805 [Sulfuricurvum sp.]|nr:hypothetical protein [Sulfuricurvum sp.]
MARDLDNFPTYDPVIKQGTLYLSNVWSDFLATMIESLREYLSQNGVFIPPLTLAQRALIQSPVEGQVIYVSNANAPALPRTAELQIWQMKAGVSVWRTVTTTP